MMDELIKEELTVKIIDILERNKLGKTEGSGRILRLRGLTDKGFNIQGGLLGAKFNVEKGLTVWNLGVRNSMPEVKVKDLYNIEIQLTELFDRMCDYEN